MYSNNSNNKQKYVRHCPKCNKFLNTDNSDEYFCPRCNSKMVYAIKCFDCNTWFDVKTHKKYQCPNCKRIISQGS
ncbi:MAG: hypothetical protein GY870_02405 [archaeon]|nr:hypothetical protein [archaeon]